MRLFIFFILLLVGCQNENTPHPTKQIKRKHILSNKKKKSKLLEVTRPSNSGIKYKIVLGSTYNQNTNKIITIDSTLYKINININSKKKYSIRDTSNHKIYLFKENAIEITINDKSFILDKKRIKSLYDNNNTWYHSNFANCEIINVDKKNKTFFFSTFFGYNQSDAGEVIQFSIDNEGNYKYIDIRSLELE